MRRRTDDLGGPASGSDRFRTDRFRTASIWVMWLILGAYLVGLLLTADVYSPLVDGWLGSITQFVPAYVCWMALHRTRSRRLQVGLASAAVTLELIIRPAIAAQTALKT